MNKDNISKILTSGSAKQRAILISEEIAREIFHLDSILTEQEAEAIKKSFKTNSEIRIWNKFTRLDKEILNAIINLSGLMSAIQSIYSDLRGYILVYNNIENTELLVNRILDEIKEEELRKKIADKASRGVNFIFSTTQVDKEGYIEISIDKDPYFDKDKVEIAQLLKGNKKKNKKYALRDLMEILKQRAIKEVIKFISWRQATLDYMEENGYNVKAYKDRIYELSDMVFTPIIGWDKYQEDKEVFIEEGKRVNKLKSKYAIAPNLNSLEVNKEDYDYFKVNFLSDE
jgi:hypothetical protein